MIKKIAYILLAIIALALYIEIAAGIFFVTFALTFGFKIIHFSEYGSFILLIVNVILLIKFLGILQENIDKTTWEEFTSTTITYQINTPLKSYNPIINILFRIEYGLMGHLYHKNVTITKNRVYRQKIDSLLEKKLKDGAIQALLYRKPRSDEDKVIFQKKFSITNILLVAILLPIHLGLITGSLLLYESIDSLHSITLTQAVKDLPQNQLGLIYLISTLLLLLYIVYLVRGIIKTGLRGFRNYPMLYDVSQGIKIDLLKSILQMVDICTNCGEVIEIREKFCSSCGQQLVKKKYIRVDDETEEELEEDLSLLQQ